jgi:hypothetical protein
MEMMMDWWGRGRHKETGFSNLAGSCPGQRSLTTFAGGGQGPPRAVEPMMMMICDFT